MSVIYVDRSQGGTAGLASDLGQLLGGSIGAGVTNSYTGELLAQAKGMSPEQRTAFLTSKLGPDGTQLANQLTQAQLDSQQQTLNAAKLTDVNYQNNIDKINAANAPALAALTLKKASADIAATQASTLASRASANYDNAGAAAAAAQAQLYHLEGQKTLIELNNESGIVKAMLGLVNDPTNPQATVDSLSNDPHVQGGNNGAPPPHVPGAPPPLTDPQGIVDQAQAVLQVSTGAASPATLAQAFPPDPPPKGISSGQAMEIGGYAAQGDLGQAGKALAAAQQPVSSKLTQRAPGVWQNLVTYQDGSPGWVGRPIYKPAPTNSKDATTANAISAWDGTVTTLSKLADPLAKSGRVNRTINKELISFGLTPILPGGSSAAAFEYTRQHAIMLAGAIERSFGGSRAQNLQNKVQDLLPKLGDSPKDAAGKVRAGQALIDIQVKTLVGQLSANGQVIPPELLDIYNRHDLADKSFSQLNDEYLPMLPTKDLTAADPVEIPEGAASDGGGGPSGEGGATPIPAGNPAPSSPPPSGPSGGLPEVTDEASYNALPPGSQYIFNGQVRTKAK